MGAEPESTLNVIKNLWAEERRAQWAVYKPQRDAFYAAYMRSYEWICKRREVLSRDNNLCVGCSQPAEQVRHLTYERLGRERLEDLASLCRECHEKVHFIGGSEFKDWIELQRKLVDRSPAPQENRSERCLCFQCLRKIDEWDRRVNSSSRIFEKATELDFNFAPPQKVFQ